MKKMLFISALMLMTLIEGCVMTTTSVSASSSMSNSKVRTYARFLTDRMAYELDFTPMQYEDCYEINYDFIYYASTVMNDVVRGYYDAINTYYRYLDYRNDDLRYVLTAAQYIRFMNKEYFYRPIYTSGTAWNFRIYTIYSNSSFYYYDAPAIFKSYRGGHSRTYYANGFYNNRYGQSNHFMGNPHIVGSSHFNDHRRSDFGTNLRDRNQKPDYNNYNNRNSNNRTADPRYRDASGNQNTPLINNRTGSGEHRGTTVPATTTTPKTSETNRGNTGNTPMNGRPQGTTPTTNTRSSRASSTSSSTTTTSTSTSTRGRK